MAVLIVEDDENNLFALTELLTLDGREVIACSGGRDAINVLQKNKDIELVICDIKMSGITGYNVIQEAKKLYPNLPFIFVTAYASMADQRVGYKLGCDRYITKPYSIQDMLSTVHELLREKENLD